MGLFALGKPDVKKMESKRDVKGLIKLLRPPISDLRNEAIEALGRIGNDKAVEELIKALNDKSSIFREGAAYAMGRIGDARAVGPPFDAAIRATRRYGVLPQGTLQSPRETALENIGQTAIDHLIQALEAEDETVRLCAAVILG